MSQFSNPEHNVNVTTAIASSPTDRIRWGAVIAGLFAAMSTLVVLTVLGIAVAGSTWDPGTNLRHFGIGAGIWGAISALIAFFVGGWMAARTAAVRGDANGVLNGSMVWVVAIPLIIWMVAGGIGSLFNTATQTATNAAGRVDLRSDDARTAGSRIEETGKSVVNEITNKAQDPEAQKQAARVTAKSAWGTLISLVVGFAAAAFGGWAGARVRYLGRGRLVQSDRPYTTGGTTPINPA